MAALRSDEVKKGFSRAPHRALFRACGLSEEDFGKPFIGIANSYCDIVPGHIHLRKVSQIAKKAIREAGGVPFEFNTIAVDDGIAMGHSGMHYSLASRELIADSVETMVEAHKLDGLLCIANCDKIVPGMLMAALRTNVPTIYLSGGPMLAGKGADGKPLDLVSVFQGVGAYKSGKIPLIRLSDVEKAACPGCGSCAGMFTANSMNCLAEAIGIALPGNGTIPAVDKRREELAKAAGKRIVEMAIAGAPTPRQIVTPASLDNAFILDMAMGGSTNTVLHGLALAHEAGFEYPLSRINSIAAKTPYICKVSPATGDVHLQDVDAAGGVSAILLEVSKAGGLDKGCPTVSGKTVGQVIATAKVSGSKVIRSISRPFLSRGGLCVLFGNLAPDGAVIKAAAVDPSCMRFVGRARCFDSEDAANDAILSGKIRPGDVVVIRFQGPKGAPGMPEMLAPTSNIVGMGLEKAVAIVTDGRFSGGTSGTCVGHVSPEAAAGGALAIVREGERILMDIGKEKLELVGVSDAEIARRQKALPKFKPRARTGWLSRYAFLVTSANTGAVLALPKD